mmetsp:Transcript_17086/g.38825  ORF Transcript_17086/g.38825 Transcript_17086/m.38825 type:complete len:315 (+) Transcript_17086:77-1021(+)
MAAKRAQGAEFLVAGTAACGAITFTNPVDVVKTRLQLQGELAAAGGSAAQGEAAYTGVGQALLRIGAREGLRGLQRGLPAAYLLQFSNVGVRFGGYDALKKLFGIRPGSSASGWASSLLMGGASGVLAALVSNPFFLLKTRYQAVGSEAVRHQHGHASLMKAFVAIGREDGVRGYYRGLSAFMPRVAAASSVQMSTYDVSKQLIMRRTGLGDGVPLHAGASLLTGVAVTLAMQPFDFAAVRVMNQAVDANGIGALYSGPWDCIRKVVQTEGVVAVYKGTLANYLRFGPYCILTFVFVEQMRKGWDRLVQPGMAE